MWIRSLKERIRASIGFSFARSGNIAVVRAHRPLRAYVD
jgi:hypothetical protein